MLVCLPDQDREKLIKRWDRAHDINGTEVVAVLLRKIDDDLSWRPAATSDSIPASGIMRSQVIIE